MISAVGQAHSVSSPDPARPNEAQLRQVAREFEAVLVAAMLKEGLKSASQTSVDGDSGGGSTYMEMTCEQLAAFIGRQGVLGIADQIVKSLTLE